MCVGSFQREEVASAGMLVTCSITKSGILMISGSEHCVQYTHICVKVVMKFVGVKKCS
jgi:hypothetical protein